jgi:HemY protein
MFRLLIFLAAVALAAWGLTWLADNPGVVTVTWRGVEYQVSLMLALGVVAALAVAIAIVWGVLGFVFRIPSRISHAGRARKRERGFAALSRGMVAVGVGDAGAASRHASEASRLIGHEPLTKLLQAQSAELAGDKEGAVAAYNAMLDHHETHGLGLRGLHFEARRAGDHAAALQYAMRANAHAPAAWAGQAVLDDRARRGDWAGALATVDSNAAARLIDKPTANRWRAVIKTAMAEEAMERDPKGALVLAQEACRLAPTLVPAAAICGRLTARAGDYRRATRILEAAYRQTPHPDLAAAYLRVRQGDSAEDRLARARTLARVAPGDPESFLTVGRAALEALDRGGARAAIVPLLASDSPHGRPTRRVCLLMADIEEAEGHQGAVREWLGRAARAPRDKAWVADGVISDRWAPVSPSGTLDAFVWRTPDERIAAPAEPLPAEPEKAPAGEEIAPPHPAPVPAPASAPAPGPQAIEPERSSAPTQASALVPALRSSVIIEPETMPPDDPGPEEPETKRGAFRLYANK